MPNEVPQEYLRPASKPAKVYVTAELYKKIADSNGGLRINIHEEVELAKKKDLIYGEKEAAGFILKAFNIYFLQKTRAYSSSSSLTNFTSEKYILQNFSSSLA